MVLLARGGFLDDYDNSGQEVKLRPGQPTCSLWAALGTPNDGKQRDLKSVSLDNGDGGHFVNLCEF